MNVELSSDLLRYLVEHDGVAGGRLPAIPELASHLGISTGKLREQLEVARTLGLVEVRPKTGIRTLGFDFFPTVSTALRYALALDGGYFEQFGALRNHIESSFWDEAVRLLEPEDLDHLERLVEAAWEKLRGHPIRIPHAEHRDLHLRIYSRLDNAFVQGLLEAYWDAYEAAGLNVYADYSYLEQVWTYHQGMVEAILRGDFDDGYQLLKEHTHLLSARPDAAPLQTPAVVVEAASGGPEPGSVNS